MKQLAKTLWYIFLFLLLATACNNGRDVPKGFPTKFVACDLVIIQDNKPLEWASVELFPVEETQKDWTIGGYTDATGTVIPYTYGKRKGVPPNTYKVTVNKQIEKKDISYSLIELQYTTTATTPLELEVKGNKSISQTFDVGTAVRVKIPD
jgi:hypothetical protein